MKFYYAGIGLVFSLILNISCNSSKKDLSNSELIIKNLGSNRNEMTHLYKNGNIKYSFQMINKLLDGKCEEYYPNGQIKYRTYWKKGEQSFISEKYLEDGTPNNINRTVKTNKLNNVQVGKFENRKKIWLSDTCKKVAMFICDYKDNFIIGKPIFIPVENGFGTLAFVAKRKSKIRGVIRVIRNKRFYEESYPFEIDNDIKNSL